MPPKHTKNIRFSTNTQYWNSENIIISCPSSLCYCYLVSRAVRLTRTIQASSNEALLNVPSHVLIFGRCGSTIGNAERIWIRIAGLAFLVGAAGSSITLCARITLFCPNSYGKEKPIIIIRAGSTSLFSLREFILTYWH